MGFLLLNRLPVDCEKRYDPIVYNDELFLSSNNDLPQAHYYWVDKTSNFAHAHIAFSLEESEAYSPLKAPFGGVEYSEELEVGQLCTFLIFVEKALALKGLKYLNITQPPENYLEQSKLYEVLKDLNYKTKSKRVYHGIVIDKENLVSKMSTMEQRRLKKCEKAQFRFESLSMDKLSEVYHAIDSWRNKAEKPLSMPWEELRNSRKSNSQMYLPYAVFDNSKMIAATIAIQVNSKVLYHFYPAHDPDYNNFSPMVMLVKGLYDWCKLNEFELLDLGTSYVNNKMNQSLIRFKKHIGGEESKALIFRKVLTSR